MIILLNAGIGEGKDTFCDLFAKHTSSTYHNIKFADPLKEMVATMTGCERSQLEDEDFKNSFLPEIWTTKEGHRYTYREVMQYVGTDLFRNQFHENTWVNASIARLVPNTNYMYTDHRFYSERDGISQVADAKIFVRVHRWMTREQWLSSKYFAGLEQDHVDQILSKQRGVLNESISKSGMVEKMRQVAHTASNTQFETWTANATYKKLTHQSELELIDAPFDFHIHNNSTLEDFEEKVRKFAQFTQEI